MGKHAHHRSPNGNSRAKIPNLRLVESSLEDVLTFLLLLLLMIFLTADDMEEDRVLYFVGVDVKRNSNCAELLCIDTETVSLVAFSVS